MVVHGVDFSGGEQAAGKIWVATTDGRVTTLRRGFDHARLVELIATSADDGRAHLWRIDAPFGLALETLEALGLEASWSAAAEWMASFDSARAWRSACRERTRREVRRATDLAARTPMAPLNLRVFKQTWSAIVRVLLPLARRGVRIEPLAGPVGAAVVVAEGCPATILHLRGWEARGYKGGGEAPRARRADLAARLRGAGAAPDERTTALAIDDGEGDGIDALLMLLDPPRSVVPARGLVEGWIW